MYGNNNNSGGMGGNYNNGANQYGHGGSGSGHGHHGSANYHQQRGMLMRNDRIRDNTLNRDQALQHWNTIRDAIVKIYAQKASSLSYEELYRTAYNLVLHKHGEMLYDNVKKTTIEMLQPIAQKLINMPDDEDLLKEITKVWDLERNVIIKIKDILLYMDKNFVPKMKNLQPVYSMQTNQFKTHVILKPQIKKKLVTLMLDEIKKERNGEQIERICLQKVVEMLIEVGMQSKRIYEQEFEAVLVQQTRDYYRNESNQLITQNSCNSYLMKANLRLNEEQDRVNSYLHQSSHDKIISEFLKEYIENHAHTLLKMENSGIIQMLKNDQFHDIKLMYSLFRRCPAALDALKIELKQYIVQEGQKIVRSSQATGPDNKEIPQSDEQVRQLVKQIIGFRERMMDLLQKSLDRDMSVDLTIKNSFESFINENDKTAKSLVMYLDDQFKKDFKNNTEVEIAEKVDKVIQIFRYLQDKDVFESFYKSSFAKRLLDSRRVLEEAEKEVIKKLKEECGFEFTQRLEVMFKDIKMSEQRMQDFKKSPSYQMLALDLNVKVLTTGHWPNESRDPSAQNQSLQKIDIIQIPPQIKQCMSIFKQYYLSKFSGRQLHWKLNQGYAEVRAKIGNNGTKRYEMSVSTYQMCILMLFNENQVVTYHDLIQNMQISDIDLKSHLIPLCQFKILQKNPMGKDFKMDDQFRVNFNYHNNLIRIKVPVVHSKIQKNAESADLSNKVEDNRKHIIDATVVKIMKSRRRIDHTTLIAEATKLLSTKFQPDPQAIKKRIEGLIEREYMERDKDDRRYYKYMA